MESRCVPVSCGAVESACRPSVALAMNSVYRVRSSCKRKSDRLIKDFLGAVFDGQ